MIELKDILFSIFADLRRKRVPLGMPDYLVAFSTVNNLIDDPENSENLEVIQELCRLFWAKSVEDQQLFDETFETYASKYQAMQKKAALPPIPPSPSTPHMPPPPDTPKYDPPVPPIKPQQPRPPVIAPRIHPPQGTNPVFPKELHYKGMRTYHLTPRPPLDRRDMASIWRKLRRPQREGLSSELDVQATTDAFAQTGFLFQPVLQYHRRNQAKLVLMIDQGGSMEPFRVFLAAVLDSILRSGSLKQIDTFFFHDVPEEYVYQSPILFGARSLESVLMEHCQSTSVLIIGDAGAARGHYDSARVRETKKFVEQLSMHTYLYSWLNLVPRTRWAYTTASYIAELLPMFALDWEGLNDTVNVLRGQSLTGAQEP
jgi:uncharacterized protein